MHIELLDNGVTRPRCKTQASQNELLLFKDALSSSVISKYHFTSSNPWPQTDQQIPYKSNSVSFCGEAVVCFVSMVTPLPSTQDNNESSQRPPEYGTSSAFELLWCLELHNLTFSLRMPPTPIISGFLRPATIGLASKGMTQGTTKLQCLSVRLGLYPTDICWLRLIQAPEKPGIRVRHRWLFPSQFCLTLDSEREREKNCFQILILFLQTLNYNCLQK